MKLLVITAGFYDRDYIQKLEKLGTSANKYHIELKIYGKGEFFSFYDSKIKKMARFLNTFKDDYTHVLYTDAQDSIFLTDLDEIITKYKQFNTPLILSGERNCYPYPEFDSRFPDDGLPYRFFNAGNFMGEIPYVLDCLSKLTRYHYINNNDNAHWMLGYNERYIDFNIDHYCELFQTMSDTEFGKEVVLYKDRNNWRIKNVITDTLPCIIHFNGPKGSGSINEKHMNEVFERCIL